MKIIHTTFKVLFVVHFLFFTVSLHAQTKEIVFEKGSFSDIKTKAKSENKLVFMDCYTSWCGPCKMMAKETFTNDTVASYFNENFINCSFDMEKGEGIKLANDYKIGCYPTLLIIDGEGTIIHRVSGYMNVSDFMKFSNDALSSQNSFSAIEKKYKSNQDDADATIAYIKKLSATCMSYDEVLNSYLSRQKEEDLINEKNWRIITDYVTNYNSREFQFILNHLDLFRKKYPEEIIWSDVDNFSRKIFKSVAESYGKDSNKSIKDIEELLSIEKKFNLKGFSDTTAFEMKLNFYSQKEDWKSYITLCLKDADRFLKPDYTNEVCWNIFLNSDDKQILEKAIIWMEKQRSFYKTYYDWGLNGDLNITPDGITNQYLIYELAYNVVYAPWDTYASLLFKDKKKKEAKVNAENAIKVGKRFGIFGVSETEELLKKILKL